MPTPTYQVTVRRDGKFWFIEIPEIDGATQARRIDEIDEMARDYIASSLDIDPKSFELSVKFELPEAAALHAEAAERLRDAAAAAQALAADESRAAAWTLKGLGLTFREVGTLLGVSHQRAQQLVVTYDGTMGTKYDGTLPGGLTTLDLVDARSNAGRILTVTTKPARSRGLKAGSSRLT
ncbi:hypothetical protein AS850_02595 [Frondihabitans sp. 762G35]|uniref:hypothetical protein n=1 Tax=Frondihabitans sp. 762G35 TaxID=1446794 RepID=UPI000D1FEE60|nr:hypothetical protein [Frondihabitans sp. 762G35]ARC55961.1 hypothetical protein AS850_02595 [Frondihabitans sp. 762G35]